MGNLNGKANQKIKKTSKENTNYKEEVKI